MKNLKKWITLFLVAVLCIIPFSSIACAGGGEYDSVSGKTYGFYSMESKAENVTITANVGEEFQGIMLDETCIMIKFGEDNTCVLYSYGDIYYDVSWEQDGNKVYINDPTEEEPIIAKISGTKLIISESDYDPSVGDISVKITLKSTTRKIPSAGTSSYKTSRYTSSKRTSKSITTTLNSSQVNSTVTSNTSKSSSKSSSKLTSWASSVISKSSTSSKIPSTSSVSSVSNNGRPEVESLTINVWGEGPEQEVNVFQNLVNTFNSTIGAQNGIYVRYTPQSIVYDAIGNRFNSSSCPDVFYVGDNHYKKLAKLGYLLDITDWAENSIEANPYEMWDSIYDTYYYDVDNKLAGANAIDGRWYGLPINLAPTVLYYNETMLKNAGVTVISLAEENVKQFNNNPNVFKDDKGKTFTDYNFTQAIPAKGYFVQDDTMVFNNQIAMSWEEVRNLATVISEDASTSSTNVYGYFTEWWFSYGRSVGGDNIQYVDVTGTADEGIYVNNGVYDFTLCDDTDNFIVAEGKNITINGNYYGAGETISYQDKLTNEYDLLNITNKADLAIYDNMVLSALSNGTLVKLPSQREALIEFVLLFTDKNVAITDSTIGTKNGYGVCPSPVHIGGDGAKTSIFKDQKLGMLVDGLWNVADFRDVLSFEWDVAPLPIYKAYDNQGNCIARGKEAGHIGSTALGINAWLGENNPEKAEAAWKFVEFVAGAEGQTQQSLAGFAIPSQKHIAMATDNNGTCTDGTSRGVFLNQKDEQGNLLKPYNMQAFVRAAEVQGVGDWAYLDIGTIWIDGWANLLFNSVRNGRISFTDFMTSSFYDATYEYLRDITNIIYL